MCAWNVMLALLHPFIFIVLIYYQELRVIYNCIKSISLGAKLLNLCWMESAVFVTFAIHEFDTSQGINNKITIRSYSLLAGIACDIYVWYICITSIVPGRQITTLFSGVSLEQIIMSKSTFHMKRFFITRQTVSIRVTFTCAIFCIVQISPRAIQHELEYI